MPQIKICKKCGDSHWADKPCPTCQRTDTLEAAQARIAELERHLGGSLAVITDYLEYEHDGDPWTEDARTMGEMEINEYERSGQLKEALAALQEGKG